MAVPKKKRSLSLKKKLQYKKTNTLKKNKIKIINLKNNLIVL